MYKTLRTSIAHTLLHERIVIAADSQPGRIRTLAVPMRQACQTVAIGQPHVSHQHLGAAARQYVLFHLRPRSCNMHGQLGTHSLQILRHASADQRVVIQNDSVGRLSRHKVQRVAILNVSAQ